jgi:hypothetical protein
MYDRSKSIGASDAVMIAAGEWAQLFDRKTLSDAAQAPLAAAIGHATEALNRELFEAETKLDVAYDPDWENCPFEHEKYPWMRYTPDGIIETLEAPIPFEAKAVNMMWKPENLVAKYKPQLLHQMIVLDAPYAYLSVIYLNTRFEIYKVDFDSPAAHHLIEQEELFMFMLERGIRPPEYQGKRKGWTA